MFLPTAEGYVSAVYPNDNTGGNPPKYAYVSSLRDHLGNLRLSITRENNRPTILQERHYYPFGMLHAGYGKPARELYYDTKNRKIYSRQTAAGRYKYWYQEQERQTDLDLNWDSFKYRNYDYAIGRFMSVDPLAEKFPHFSPYQFAGNKPTWSREIEGLESGVDAMMMANAYNSLDEEGKKAWREGETAVFLTFTSFLIPEEKLISWGVKGVKYAAKAGKKLFKLTKNFVRAEKAAKEVKSVEKAAKVKNPFGSKGKPDHQAKVKELVKKAEKEFPDENNYEIVQERKIHLEGSNRRPDVQVVDKETKKTVKVYEAERHPNSTRNLRREEEYRKLGVDYETHPVNR